jgi:hypothetical protein
MYAATLRQTNKTAQLDKARSERLIRRFSKFVDRIGDRATRQKAMQSLFSRRPKAVISLTTIEELS